MDGMNTMKHIMNESCSCICEWILGHIWLISGLQSDYCWFSLMLHAFRFFI